MKSWLTRLSGLVICVALFLATAQVSAQTTWYVDDDNCPGPGAGTEADPFCTIQDGIDTAQDGDTVLVADGLYTGDGNRDLDFGGSIITVLSASGDPTLCVIDCQGTGADPHRGFLFHSGETSDAVVEGLTIRNGSIGHYGAYEMAGGGIRCEASSPTFINCRIVDNIVMNHLDSPGGGIFADGESSPTFIDCVITGNDASGASGSGRGGGAYFAGGNPTLINCIFSENKTTGFTVIRGLGGGIYCVGGSPTITGCTITDNHGERGGGLYLRNATPTIANSVISGNSATGGYGGGWGGGMYNLSSSPTITSCLFADNSTATTLGDNAHGGAIQNNDSNPTLTNCNFWGNVAEDNGGGLYNTSNSSPMLTDCQFVGNSAGGIGGAMVNSGNSSSPTLINCMFENNIAGLDGGAIHNNVASPIIARCVFAENVAVLGGAIFNLNSYSTSSVVNCMFIGNISLEGGGLYNQGSSPRITNCAFIDNSASLQGAGIFNIINSSPTVTNCSFSGNIAAVDGGAMYSSGESSMPMFANSIAWSDLADGVVDADGAATTVSYSDIQGGWSGAGSNNIDADPLFLDPDNGDLHLSPGSPCIDAGSNQAVAADSTDLDADGDEAEPVPIDLGGDPRFIDDPDSRDSGLGSCPLSDMGAYEFPVGLAQCCPADFDQDGEIGPSDLATLLGSWGPCLGCPEDLDGNDNVGAADLAILLGNWGPCQ